MSPSWVQLAWWADEMDRADIGSGSRDTAGMQMRLVRAAKWGRKGGSLGGGGQAAAVCRWRLAGVPQLGRPPAWPLGALLSIQSFVLPQAGQTNSCLIIRRDSGDTVIMTQLWFQLHCLQCKTIIIILQIETFVFLLSLSVLVYVWECVWYLSNFIYWFSVLPT